VKALEIKVFSRPFDRILLKLMRRKDQAARREQLARAGRQVLLERGAVGLRVKDIAERAGLAPSSVLYYYPRIEELLLEVSRDAIDRYAERRARQVRRLEDPARQLRRATHLGAPTGRDDEESRLRCELDALTGSSPAFAMMTTSFFDRQALLYQYVLDGGRARGVFQLGQPAETVARGLVALEDGLGLQVVLQHPGIDSAEAERTLLRFATLATGVDIEAVPLAEDISSRA
jgi:AcrR family transcriptional regulator